jgi:hypothetical protein
MRLHLPGRDSLSTSTTPATKGDYRSATTEYSVKSGKGLVHNVSAELATFWEVKPGHGDQLREAVKRFERVIFETPPA